MHAPSAPVRAHIRGNHFEHRYYLVAAFGIIVVILAGFSIDFPLLFDLGSLSALVRLHGVVMLTWIALFFTQTLLVTRHRVDLHRRLGIFGAALAVLVVVADTATVVVACRLGGDHVPPDVPVPLFLAEGIFNLAAFAALVGAAIVLRRRGDWHKRLMLLAAILLLDAALARFIAAYTSWTVDSSTLRNLLMLTCVVVDTLRYRRLHPAFVSGGLLLVASDNVAIWAAGRIGWMQFTAWVLS